MTSQLDPSQTASQRFLEAHLCLCNYQGLLADHLRKSEECVENLRKEPPLQMVAPNDEVFIVKATVVFRGCPAPNCPGGGHQQIPESCLVWWREIGWKIMGWKGSSENAKTATIKTKQSIFRRNFLRKDRQPNKEQHSQQTENVSTNLDSKGAQEGCCQFCQHPGSLVHHLHQTSRCLRAYVQRFLPTRGHLYMGKNDLAVFELGLVTPFCPNPACLGSLEQDGMKEHLQGACGEFYQEKGEKLYNWESVLSVTSMCDKLKKRKAYLKQFVREAGTYEENLAKALKIACFRCKIRGPLLSANEHKMFVTHTPGGIQWACSKCQNGDERHEDMVANAVERARELGTPEEYDDTMKKVVVVNHRNENQRVVFVPACVATDHEDAGVVSDAELNPRNTTVLVPKNPEALEEIGDEASERANMAKESLGRVAEFFGRRLLFGSVTESVSVLYRLKIAQIRLERLSMLKNMSSTSKGKIVSRDPNMAAVTERNPHFAVTQQFCLTNTCNWTPSAQEKRSNESAARACVNGRVKIEVQMTVLKNVAVDSTHLRDIISETLRFLGPISLISTAPLVLNYLKAKVELLVKHVISQSYQNWDLDLRFSEQEWTAKLVGFLYCKEFEELNGKIASGEVTEDEFAKEARQYQHLLPTTTTSKNKLMEVFSIAEEFAEVSNSTQNEVKNSSRRSFRWSNIIRRLVNRSQFHCSQCSLQAVSPSRNLSLL